MFECDSQIQIQSWMNKSYRVYFGVIRQSFFNGHAFQILQGPNHSNVFDLTMPKQNLKNANKTCISWPKITRHLKQWKFKIPDMYSEPLKPSFTTRSRPELSWFSFRPLHGPAPGHESGTCRDPLQRQAPPTVRRTLVLHGKGPSAIQQGISPKCVEGDAKEMCSSTLFPSKSKGKVCSTLREYHSRLAD